MRVDRAGVIEALLQASPDAVIVVGADGKIETASAPIERLFGYRPSDLVGQPVEILIPRELKAVHEAHRTRYIAHPGARAMGSGLALYGRRRDGSTLPVDVSLAPIEVDGDHFVGAFIRDATDRRRGEDVLRHVNEISRHLLAGEATQETLSLIAQRARSLVGAAAAWVVIPERGQLVVEAADGEGTEDLVGATLSATDSLSARTMSDGQPLWVKDMAADPNVVPAGRSLGLGPGIYLPMLARELVVGVLVVGRAPADDPFDPAEAQALQVFAAAASIVLSLGKAREELDALRIVSEHERIARDLHDTVIQRLFAVGMSLQGSTRLAQGAAADRIEEAVDAIDQVIREIRQTIFELNNPAAGSGGGIRGQMIDLAVESAGQLGFQPRVAFRGDVDRGISVEIASQMLTVAREGLSNVARHARASSVDIVLSAENGQVSLSVMDDGVGLPDGPTAGQGLGNLRSRAEQFGGSFRVANRRPNGTILEWAVPTKG
ncbi:MAG TPA: PAS domain S-box protein [Acidimicrobiales bacterium]|nr:PAS domain S-box protein [Acidimicrobiales bacterium]